MIFTWPRWYKDQTVYRLADAISADQLLDEYEAYAGKPPRHRLEAPRVDTNGWQARFTKKINDHFARFGTEFSIWIVRYAAEQPAPPQSPEVLIVRRCREIDRMEFMSDKAMAAVRYRPLEPWPESPR